MDIAWCLWNSSLCDPSGRRVWVLQCCEWRQRGNVSVARHPVFRVQSSRFSELRYCQESQYVACSFWMGQPCRKLKGAKYVASSHSKASLQHEPGNPACGIARFDLSVCSPIRPVAPFLRPEFWRQFFAHCTVRFLLRHPSFRNHFASFCLNSKNRQTSSHFLQCASGLLNSLANLL